MQRPPVCATELQLHEERFCTQSNFCIDAQEEAAKQKELDAEAAAAEARFLELQRKAQAAAAKRREEEAKKKTEQARVLGKNGARTKLSFKLFG